MTWFDEWLVGAPIAVQMALLLVTAVPAAAAAAWALMWLIDRPFRGTVRPETRMVQHVEPE